MDVTIEHGCIRCETPFETEHDRVVIDEEMLDGDRIAVIVEWSCPECGHEYKARTQTEFESGGSLLVGKAPSQFGAVFKIGLTDVDSRHNVEVV